MRLMHYAIVVALLFVVAASASYAADAPCLMVPIQHLSLPATVAAVAAGQPIRIVAFGSSSTAGASSPANAYPAHLAVFLRNARPGRAVTVLNKGVGGQVAHAMLACLDVDLAQFRTAPDQGTD